MKIAIRVAPNSKVEQVTRDGDRYMVRVKQPPREGKANRAVIKLLAGHFKVPQTSIRVVSGSGSKDKIIEVRGR